MSDWPPEGWAAKLLTKASPLQVLPDLALAIGLNESLMLQQLHYLSRKGGDGEGWVAKTLDEWRSEYFPFWHRDTVKRAGSKLREMNLVEVAQRHGQDRRTSYRIKYDTLEEIAGGQFAPFNRAACTLQEGISPPSSNTTSKRNRKRTTPDRDAVSVEDAPLSHLLADLIAANDPDGKRPKVTKRWAQAEDRLQRLDGRSPAQIEVVIRWVQADGFWRSNVQSMTKLREKYPALVQKAVNKAPERDGGKPASTADADIQRLTEARERLEKEGR